MTKREIKEIVSMTLDELLARDLIKDDDIFNYQYMSAELKAHYHSKPNKKLAAALTEIRFDPYFYIIPEYYNSGHSLQYIAIDAGRDRSVIVRNKKRLVLELYKLYTA